MNLEWHELLITDKKPCFPKDGRPLVFHNYDTGDTWYGYYDDQEKSFFSVAKGSALDPDEVHISSFIAVGAYRIAWAYLDINKVNFPKFESGRQPAYLNDFSG